jgi:DnaK suppressor protein
LAVVSAETYLWRRRSSADSGGAEIVSDVESIILALQSETSNMHENIAKALHARLSELTGRVAEIESELRKPLSADSEERATDLENQEALETIENSEKHEIRQIQEALNKISEGSYGICAECGADIDPKRLRALPTATRCISCAA